MRARFRSGWSVRIACGAGGSCRRSRLYLNLCFISINKLRRARFCARGGKLNLANACIYARASYFWRAPRAEIARPRIYAHLLYLAYARACKAWRAVCSISRF